MSASGLCGSFSHSLLYGRIAGPQESKQGFTTTATDSCVIWTEVGLTDIPKEHTKNTKIRVLNLSSNLIPVISDNLLKFKTLQTLILSNNCIASIPQGITELGNLKQLSLSNNKLRSINPSIWKLPKLEFLDLSYNEIITIPGDMSGAKSLKELYLHSNLLVDLPDSFGDLSLTKLTLEDNPPLTPSLARLSEGGGEQARFVTTFVRFRRDTPLPEGWVASVSQEKGLTYFINTDTEEKTWVDPRYFLYIHRLPFHEQRLFSFMGEPADFETPLIPLAAQPTASSYSSPASQCLLASPFGSLPQPPLRLLGPTGLPSVGTSVARGAGSLATPALCANPFCTNPCDAGCVQGMCSRCCTEARCTVHAQRLAQRRAQSFDARANALWKTIQSMHYPEPESWREKPRLKLTLRRDHLLADSFRDIMRANPERLKLRLNVTYFGETGLDYGGLAREWFSLISKDIVKPDYALFRPCEGNPGVYQINPQSYVNPAHLEYFRFVGRVLAKALFDRFLFGAYFTPIFYKGLQGLPVTLEDLKLMDMQEYNSLKQVAETEDVEDLCLTFSHTTMQFGEVKEIDLIENGRNIDVTKENRDLFIQLKALYLLQGQVKEQMDQVRFGFNELIPPELVEDFSLQEMEKLICGSMEIDVNDWKKNTNYSNYTSTTQVIVWFWEILEKMNNEGRTNVFQFVTGTTKVPQGGFANLVGSSGPRKFLINRVPKAGGHLPSSHTCFNQLDLPEYTSKQELEEKLLKAIELGLTGFGEK